jgi:hypothetical protein
MDDELNALEAELRHLRPVAPSAALARRIARELAPAAPRAPQIEASLWPWRWAAVTLPAAAGVALLMFAPAPPVARPAPAVAADVLKPVAAENVLYAARDEGLVTLADGTPARRARYNYVDTITWENPRTRAVLTWSVPREEVRVVPVVFQ